MPDNLESSSSLLKSVGHPIRLKIILTLADHIEMTVTELTQFLKIEQPVMSLHLAVLRNANIIIVRKQGKKSMYSILDSSVLQAVQIIYHSRGS